MSREKFEAWLTDIEDECLGDHLGQIAFLLFHDAALRLQAEGLEKLAFNLDIQLQASKAQVAALEQENESDIAELVSRCACQWDRTKEGIEAQHPVTVCGYHQAERDAQQARWTTEKPAVPGWYWYRVVEGIEVIARVGIVSEGTMRAWFVTDQIASCGLDTLDGEWSDNALSPPPARTEEGT